LLNFWWRSKLGNLGKLNASLMLISVFRLSLLEGTEALNRMGHQPVSTGFALRGRNVTGILFRGGWRQ
jgi:hypothetical protein